MTKDGEVILARRGAIGTAADLRDASRIYQRAREESGEGYRAFPEGRVRFDGEDYAISYNGRVWIKGRVGQPDALVVEAA